jgi:cyanophycin synthetase
VDGTFDFSGADERQATVWNWRTQLDGGEAATSALDKPELDRRLAEAGIPAPVHLEFRRSRQSRATAFRFLEQHGGPCVVKPAAESGGYGVTCGVRTGRDLTQALVAAAPFGSRLLIERQVAGDVFRLLFLDGVLLDVLRRRPSEVVGDGRSTIAALLEAENLRRLQAHGRAGFHLIRPDLDCVLTLRAAGLRLRSIPADGARVAVKTSTGDAGAAETETIDQTPAAALVEAAAAAVSLVGARLAGVDLVTRDLNRDLRSSGGAILEVNVPPGLHYHYLVAAPERATRVAVPILRTLLEQGLEQKARRPVGLPAR